MQYLGKNRVSHFPRIYVLSIPDSSLVLLVHTRVPDFPRALHQFCRVRNASSRGNAFRRSLGRRCGSVIRCESVSRLGERRLRTYRSASTTTGRETPALPTLTMASFQCLAGLTISRWAVNILPPLPFFSHGNVAILGDAVGLRLLCDVPDT